MFPSLRRSFSSVFPYLRVSLRLDDRHFSFRVLPPQISTESRKGSVSDGLKKVEPDRTWPETKNVRLLRLFLSLYQYFRYLPLMYVLFWQCTSRGNDVRGCLTVNKPHWPLNPSLGVTTVNSSKNWVLYRENQQFWLEGTKITREVQSSLKRNMGEVCSHSGNQCILESYIKEKGKT